MHSNFHLKLLSMFYNDSRYSRPTLGSGKLMLLQACQLCHITLKLPNGQLIREALLRNVLIIIISKFVII